MSDELRNAFEGIYVHGVPREMTPELAPTATEAQEHKLTARKRTLRSAKAAGSSFERLIADHLRDALGIREIDRMPKTGALDKGDIANVRDHHDRLIAIECKNTAKMSLPTWVREAQAEALNYGAHVGVTIHKRHGVGEPGKQWVSMELDDLIRLITIQEDA